MNYLFAFSERFLCQVELNAFARSKRVAAVFFSFSMFSITVVVKNNTASVSNVLFWNPN